MTEIIRILLSPEFLAAIGPFGMYSLMTLYALYKLFKRYDVIQEKRLLESQSMQKEYFELAKDVEKTLDMLVNIITAQRNSRDSNGK